MPAPLILLPPSEGKADGGTGGPWAAEPGRFAVLDPKRRAVIKALRRAMRGDGTQAEKLLGVGTKAAAAAIAANRAVDAAATSPAILRYTGVLYDALDYPALTPQLRRRVDDQVVILSGLWGLVAPRDPIPDYKLKMGATLQPMGKLSTWWRPAVSPLLDDLAAGTTVWNLLPGEHAATWRPSGVEPSDISVRFLDEVTRNGSRELVTVSHWNKLLKGALVRYVLEHQLVEPEGLEDFAHPEGYRYRPDLTTRRGNTVFVSMVARR